MVFRGLAIHHYAAPRHIAHACLKYMSAAIDLIRQVSSVLAHADPWHKAERGLAGKAGAGFVVPDFNEGVAALPDIGEVAAISRDRHRTHDLLKCRARDAIRENRDIFLSAAGGVENRAVF